MDEFETIAMYICFVVVLICIVLSFFDGKED